MSPYAIQMPVCFVCSGPYRHLADCPLNHAGGQVKLEAKYVTRSALGEYWLSDEPTGDFHEFYREPYDVVAAVYA